MFPIATQTAAATHPQGDDEITKASVTLWMARLKASEKRQEDAFKEMRDSMKFCAGYQWGQQKQRDDSRYVANFTLQEVNKRVAQLYARNPTAEYQRRKRLDFQIYNGKLESIMPVLQAAQAHPELLTGLPIAQRALLLDFHHGMEERDTIDAVGKTLEIAFQYLIDEQDEEGWDFKQAMKALVRRVEICKVGYVRVAYVTDGDVAVTSTGLANTVMNKAKQVAHLAGKASDGSIEPQSEKMQQLQNLAVGLGGTIEQRMVQGDIKERVIYDFLPPTSVLVDPNCRQLKGFIGCQWIAIKYCLPKDDVNALFEVDLSPEKQTSSNLIGTPTQDTKESAKKRDEENVTIYEVYDKRTKTHFFVAQGYEKFLQEPELVQPFIRGFWPVNSLTFNDIECDPTQNQSPFPPSTVEILRPIQKEWNRSRNDLKKHKKANTPRWMVKKGVLTEDDKTNLANMETNDCIEVEGLGAGDDITRVIAPVPKQPIEPAVYDALPLAQDINATTGSNQPPIRPQQTATGQTIDAQQQLTVTASNIDDLDDFLTWIARATGEIVLQKFSIQTMQTIAGPGACMPTMPSDRQMFLSQIYLVTKAASSGRPNKAIEMSNWQKAAPVLQASGANPQFLVRETLRRLDENVDPEQAFPLIPMNNPASNMPPAGGQHQPSEQPPQEPGAITPPEQTRPGPGAQFPGQLAPPAPVNPFSQQ